MLRFNAFLTETINHAGGILHIEHPADRVFDNNAAAHHSLKTLRKVMKGTVPITRKIDDRMSYQAVRTPEGRVGVKYKGKGSTYNFSHSDIEKQHGHKPYLAQPLKTLITHLPKVLPKRPGEYQGGFMSAPEHRQEHDNHISHTPNTIQYRAQANSTEGKKLKNSKVSTVIHTELKGPERISTPITSTHEFVHHPDVHMVNHVVSDNEKRIPPESQKLINIHLKHAAKALKGT